MRLLHPWDEFGGLVQPAGAASGVGNAAGISDLAGDDAGVPDTVLSAAHRQH